MSGYSEENKRVRYIAFCIFMFFISIYLLTSLDTTVYDTDASLARYEATKSIAERFDLSIPDGFGIKGIDGRDYSWFGIGYSILSVPFYITGKLAGISENAVSIMNQLFGAATVVLVFLFPISLGYSKRASVLVAFFYGLGTMAWPYAKHPFDHVVETFFVLLSVYCMHLYVINKRVSLITFSAISFGVAFITRYTSVLAIPPLFIMMTVYYLKKSDLRITARLLVKDIVLFSLAFLPFLGIFLWYNYYRFGSIFETGYSLIAARTGLNFFAGTSLLTGLMGFLISPGKGFFYYSPVAIIFFFSIKSFIKKHSGLAICFICLMISYLLFLSRNVYWHGDWAWGPRYIFVLTPFFIIPIAGLLDSNAFKKIYFRRFVYFIFSVSLIIQVAAVSVDFQKYFITLRHYEKVQFTIAHGDGVQPIVEPPSDTYFDWGRSPIFAQFKFIYDIAVNLKDYRYFEPPKDATISEIIEASPYMHVFDFWWLYRYFIYNDYNGFIVAFLLLFTAIYIASRLKRAFY